MLFLTVACDERAQGTGSSAEHPGGGGVEQHGRHQLSVDGSPENKQSQLNTLKFKDLVDFKTIQLMYRIKNDQLPNSIQRLFEWRECIYYLRGIFMFKRHFVRTKSKFHCITVKGVELWNASSEELKNCSTLIKFKKIYKDNILKGYRLL